jgi:tRNA dimethylallyltransferase
MQKLIAIVGPTASGKTAYAITLAKQIGGEIINADSRQIYAGFPATTAKPSDDELQSAPHHLIGVAPINAPISVTQYQEMATAAITEIANRGNVPILAGGTGHWIDAVVYGQTFPNVPPDFAFRTTCLSQPTDSLYAQLLEKDPRRARALDPHNKKRIIRALEIIHTLGHVPQISPQKVEYDLEIIGIAWPLPILRERIEVRTDLLLDEMLREATDGLETLSNERAQELGFDFTIPRAYLRNTFSKDEFLMRLKAARWQYAKRQLRWFNRNSAIRWVSH